MSSKNYEFENQSFQEIHDRIISDTGLIFVDTPEETRLIRNIYKKFREHNVQFWSFTQGLISIPPTTDPDRMYPHDYYGKSIRSTSSGASTKMNPIGAYACIEEDARQKIADEKINNKNIYILRDADKFLDSPAPLRALRDIIYLTSMSGSSIIICGFGLKIPADLEKDSVFIKLSYPTKKEIKEKYISEIVNKLEIHNKQCNKDTEQNLLIDTKFDIDQVAQACTGLTEDQIYNTLSYSTTINRKIDLDLILEEKKQIINKSDILEYWKSNDTMDDVGGFNEFKRWLQVRKTCMMSEHAEEFKVKAPKGILLLGTQGSGKTHVAKATANILGLPLIKFESAKVFAGLVGESEKRMRMALAQVEAAGGVVVIDEIDKALSGAGSSDKTDGGTTSRVIGTLLTWLQEDHPGVFLIATANDITNIRRNHPELLRKGRFDEIWFSDVPNFEERKEIFKIHLIKTSRDPSRLDLDKLAEYEFNDGSSDKYALTGAEIEYSINDTIQEVFARKNGKRIEINSKDDITTEDILERLKLIKPISWLSKDVITPMRKWSSENARSVSSTNVITKDKKKNKKSINIRNTITNDVDLDI